MPSNNRAGYIQEVTPCTYRSYGTIFPYMIVDGANAFIDFLENVFGATEVGRTEFPEGRVANIEVQLGTSRFMIGEADNETSKPMPASYYLYVEDVDQTLEKAIAHGATAVWRDRHALQGPAGGGYRSLRQCLVDFEKARRRTVSPLMIASGCFRQQPS